MTPQCQAATRRPRHPGLLLCAAVALATLLAPARANGRAAQPSFPSPPTIAECLHRFHRPCLTPAQIYAAYDINPLLARGVRGRGRTIAVIDSFGSPTIRADLHVFDQAFGLPDPRLTVLAPLGEVHPRRTGWLGETTLDVEWAHAIAPDASIVLLESPVDETEGVQGLPQFLALERYAMQHHLADVISQSWGATEETLLDPAGRRIVAQFHRFYADAAARGITVVAGSGDEGAAGIDLSLKRVFPTPAVGYPASDPLVLAAGGSQLAVTPSGQIGAETAWAGSGGGVSTLFAEPAYQRALPATAQRLLAGHRGLPDVAYNASDRSPVLIYLAGKWGPAAGTSAAAPQWAALVALADQMAHRDLGLIQPALYRLAASPRYAADLRDITAGASVGPIDGGKRLGGIGFRAGPGWDAVTGLGAPRAAALIPDLVRFSNAPTSPRS